MPGSTVVNLRLGRCVSPEVSRYAVPARVARGIHPRLPRTSIRDTAPRGQVDRGQKVRM